MKALIIGTSNCLLAGGARQAIEEHFGVDNVVNLSLGATSGTFLAIFRFIEGLDVTQFDYVFFDSIVNEQWQMGAGRSPKFLWQAARMLYAMLPAGVTYVYLGFCIISDFYRVDFVENLHQSLCRQFEINFISLRQLLVEFVADNALKPEAVFIKADPAHFKTALSSKLVSFVLQLLPSLPKKTRPSLINQSWFFIQDSREQAPESITHTTSLRSQTYGLFSDQSRVTLAQGSFLGFDHCELETEAYLRIYGDRVVQKILTFNVDRPWMKVSAFNDEVITAPGAYMDIYAEPLADLPIEHTDSTINLGRPASGNAKLGSFYFSRLPVAQLLRASGADTVVNYDVPTFFDLQVIAKMRDQNAELLTLTQG